MSCAVLPIDPRSPDEKPLREAADLLRGGRIVAVPTETFYGLAADALDPAAVRRVNALKAKPADSPVLLLLSDPEQVVRVGDPASLAFRALTEAFWPGALSLVIPAVATLPREVSGGRGTVAVRVPGAPVPRMLASLLGGPITGVSANRHGRPPCSTAREVAEAFPDGLALVLDGGPTPGAAPSTLVDLTGSRPRLLREGAVAASALRRVVPDLAGPETVRGV